MWQAPVWLTWTAANNRSFLAQIRQHLDRDTASKHTLMATRLTYPATAKQLEISQTQIHITVTAPPTLRRRPGLPSFVNLPASTRDRC
ncbi:Transcription initiation factor TFIID subunit 6 [Fusarium oxysporum f. sp. albedinis]|nr:Transcription initiation factor TFIID subunit 6 [Fusarium oxysporum f. sp. albedinis]